MQKRNRSTEPTLRCRQLLSVLTFNHHMHLMPAKGQDSFTSPTPSDPANQWWSAVYNLMRLCKVMICVLHAWFALTCMQLWYLLGPRSKPARWQNSCFWSRDLLTLWMRKIKKPTPLTQARVLLQLYHNPQTWGVLHPGTEALWQVTRIRLHAHQHPRAPWKIHHANAATFPS